jgi:hypothetical protein
MNASQKVMVLALLAMVAMVIPALGKSDVQSLRAYFTQAIDKEICCCQQKCALQSSRSANLRKKGHREARKAIFLKSHKEEIVEKMLSLGLEPKPYKVDLYLNHQFRTSVAKSGL